MNILILGSGGREHTFAWKIAQSPMCNQLFVAPGNAGTSEVAINVEIDVLEFAKIAAFCLSHQIDLVLVGPEVPLVAGIVDYFKSKDALSHITIVGPNQQGAQLEGSKDFSKQFMNKYGIPTASSRTFDFAQLQDGITYLETHPTPIVLKADGLAAGKGVIITNSVEEAKSVLTEMLAERKFGEASAKVVVEQFLDGIELSLFTLSDGENYILLPEAKDYKRIGEGDTGLNTGGMGAVSPVPFADEFFMQKVKEKIILPTIQGLQSEKIDYVGFIFFGLINVGGNPYVIEYNARMGDPETEVVIPRIENDFVEILKAVADKKLNEITIRTTPKSATTLMLVAGGYPEKYQKGDEIFGLENISKDTVVFHAGTKKEAQKILTNGGRVMALTSLGNNISDALQKSNRAAETVQWKNKYYRRDIGKDVLKFERIETYKEN